MVEASACAAERELLAFANDLSGIGARFPELTGFFAGSVLKVCARAPGRLDVMGGIADYSGSLVLEQPLAEAALVAAARTSDQTVRIATLADRSREVSFPARELYAQARTFEGARRFCEQLAPHQRWVKYVVGTLAALSVDLGGTLECGLRVLVQSTVPEGKGVSSSAAIEVACLRALAALFGVPVTGAELALSCQRAENLVVGAACGVMDQMTSACGRQGELMMLLCQPAEVRGFIAPGPDLALWGIDSGVRHAVSGADYVSVRTAAFMGLRILAPLFGATVRWVGHRAVFDDDRLGGYLANLTHAELTQDLYDRLPVELSGEEFLREFGGISDVITRVDPRVHYRVRAATLHPIYEHARVREFAARLPAPRSQSDLEQLGSLMFDSHASYSACGLGTDATDRLIALVRETGSNQGLYGAKMTGGGSGGVVVVLAHRDAAARVHDIARQYAEERGTAPRVFSGSSPGAMQTPVVQVP